MVLVWILIGVIWVIVNELSEYFFLKFIKKSA